MSSFGTLMDFWSGRVSTGAEAPPQPVSGSVGRVFQSETAPRMSCLDVGSSDLSYVGGLASPDEMFDRSVTSLVQLPMEQQSLRSYRGKHIIV